MGVWNVDYWSDGSPSPQLSERSNLVGQMQIFATLRNWGHNAKRPFDQVSEAGADLTDYAEQTDFDTPSNCNSRIQETLECGLEPC